MIVTYHFINIDGPEVIENERYQSENPLIKVGLKYTHKGVTYKVARISSCKWPDIILHFVYLEAGIVNKRNEFIPIN